MDVNSPNNTIRLDLVSLITLTASHIHGCFEISIEEAVERAIQIQALSLKRVNEVKRIYNNQRQRRG